MAAVTTYHVTARRWARGWELHIEGVGVTQSTTLAAAEQTVRDYLETLLDTDTTEATVVIAPDLGGLGDRVERARERTRAAQEAQQVAARESREVACALREAGLSVTDAAAVLGVSRGRVTQLTSSKPS
jgi:DNA-directed RNA polymerase specialized sigma subunit